MNNSNNSLNVKSFIAFMRKEFLESVRTYKFYILLAVFAIFGIMSPLLAKLTPEILKGVDLGFEMEIAEPIALDSWTQYFKNIGQMGMLALMIVYSGLTAGEFTKGTLINLLTKGMSRINIILAKFFSSVIIWTCVYLASWLICFGYTVYFWGNNLDLSFIAFFGLWLFGVFLIALLILGGILFKNAYGSLLLTGGLLIALSIAGISPDINKYNPAVLSGDTLNILYGAKTSEDFTAAIIVCAVAIVAFVVVAVCVFRKREV